MSVIYFNIVLFLFFESLIPNYKLITQADKLVKVIANYNASAELYANILKSSLFHFGIILLFPFTLGNWDKFKIFIWIQKQGIL